MSNFHTLEANRHSTFLTEGRNDPFTKERLKSGDRVVFCANCHQAFLADSWQQLNGKHCNQSGTLSSFPSTITKTSFVKGNGAKAREDEERRSRNEQAARNRQRSIEENERCRVQEKLRLERIVAENVRKNGPGKFALIVLTIAEVVVALLMLGTFLALFFGASSFCRDSKSIILIMSGMIFYICTLPAIAIGFVLLVAICIFFLARIINISSSPDPKCWFEFEKRLFKK